MFKGIGSVVVIGAIILFSVMRNTPGWEKVDSGSVAVGDDESYILELEMYRSGKVKVIAKEQDGKDLVVYWLRQADHQAIQNGTAEEGVLTKMEAQSFFSGKPSGESERQVPKGNVFIYLEAEEFVPVQIDYEVFIYQ